MAGFARKSRAQRFPFLFCAFICSTCRFVVFSLRSHARLLFPLSSGPRSEPTKSRAKPDGFSLVHLIVPLVKYREGDKRWSEVRIYLANSFQLVGARRRENPPVILSPFRACVLVCRLRRARFGWWKTGRFGPIGPETAQCQLPHNIVTFGMVRARDARVSWTWMQTMHSIFESPTFKNLFL